MPQGLKLYYDMALAGASAAQVVALTRVSAGAPGDRNGRFLDALPALTGSAIGDEKAAREITAVFVPYAMTLGGAAEPFVFVQFLHNATDLAPYITAGGALVPSKAGTSGVFATNPRVRCFLANGSGNTVRGTLYVQRQHSLEV